MNLPKQTDSYQNKLKAFFTSSDLKKKYDAIAEDLTSDMQVTSFGVPVLDVLSGIGGVVDGGHIEVYGKWSSTKSTLSNYFGASRQKKDPRLVLVLNYEGAINPDYLAVCGYDLSPTRLQVVTPPSLEKGFQLVWDLMKENLISTVIVDSLAAGVEHSAVDKSDSKKNSMAIGHRKVAGHAAATGLIFQQVTADAWKKKVTFWWNNQLRNLVGVMFGSNETTSGGNAPKFFAYGRIDLRMVGLLKEKTETAVLTGGTDKSKKCYGLRIKANFTKNKYGKAFNPIFYNVIHQQGIDILQSRVDVLIAKEILKKNTKGYYKPLNEEIDAIMADCPQLGTTNTPKAYFEKNPKILDALESYAADMEIKEFEEIPENVAKVDEYSVSEGSDVEKALEQMKGKTKKESTKDLPETNLSELAKVLEEVK